MESIRLPVGVEGYEAGAESPLTDGEMQPAAMETDDGGGAPERNITSFMGSIQPDT